MTLSGSALPATQPPEMAPDLVGRGNLPRPRAFELRSVDEGPRIHDRAARSDRRHVVDGQDAKIWVSTDAEEVCSPL